MAYNDRNKNCVFKYVAQSFKLYSKGIINISRYSWTKANGIRNKIWIAIKYNNFTVLLIFITHYIDKYFICEFNFYPNIHTLFENFFM